MAHPINEHIVNWVTVAGGGRKSVMYCDAADSVTAQRDAIHNMLMAVRGVLTTETVFFQNLEGRVIDADTGTLVGAWTDNRDKGNGGSATGQGVPDAAQVLLRWTTGGIAGGRFVKGRQFIPGLAVSALVGGNVGSAALATFSTAAAGLVSASVGFCVWHRPVLGTGGSFHEATVGSAWNELAVLRRRRT